MWISFTRSKWRFNDALIFSGNIVRKPFRMTGPDNLAELPKLMVENIPVRMRNGKGPFEAAHKGTIFLDEIGEMSAACQVKLLRVLQEATIRPVGARSETQVDARVITATNRDLVIETQAGRFREDLFYRIAVLAINTPPLRKRVSDIPLLVDHFLCEAEKRFKCSRKRNVEKEAIGPFSSYGWPGNVRQLRHVVEKLVATTMDGDVITAEAAKRALPNGQLSSARAEIPLLYHENDSLEVFLDRTLLSLYEQMLAKTGNHSKAARLLRIDRTSLYQRLERARRRVHGSAS